MTLEQLKSKYKALSEMSAKRGNMYNAKAEEYKAKGYYEEEKAYIEAATKEFREASIYIHFVNELLSIK